MRRVTVLSLLVLLLPVAMAPAAFTGAGVIGGSPARPPAAFAGAGTASGPLSQPLSYFLTIDGIQGESRDARAPNAIEPLTYTLAFSQPIAGTTTAQGVHTGERVDIEPLIITKYVDKASLPLMLRCCTGQHITEVVLTARRQGSPKDALKYTLRDVVVSSVKQVVGANNVPLEEVSLTFGTIDWEYQVVGADGRPASPVRGGWSVLMNQARSPEGDGEETGKETLPVITPK